MSDNGGETTQDDGNIVWWAFHPGDDAGVFVPYAAWPVRKSTDLPTEAELQRVARKAQRTVEVFGGEPGLVEGYMTDDADFYVAVPSEVLQAYLDQQLDLDQSEHA